MRKGFELGKDMKYVGFPVGTRRSRGGLRLVRRKGEKTIVLIRYDMCNAKSELGQLWRRDIYRTAWALWLEIEAAEISYFPIS